jgi:hypothetical protein
MAIYLADQFAELTKFDPVLDRMVTGAGRLILAVRADSLEEAYQTALKDAKETERRYLSMAANASKYLVEELGMPASLVDEVLPGSRTAFDRYRLAGVGNVSLVSGDVVDFAGPECQVLRSFPLRHWMEPEGGLPDLPLKPEGFEDRVPGEAARFVEMRFLDRATGVYQLQTLYLHTTEAEFPARCVQEANRIVDRSRGQLCFANVINYATSQVGWVDGVYELMDEFTYDPEFVDFYRSVRLTAGDRFSPS